MIKCYLCEFSFYVSVCCGRKIDLSPMVQRRQTCVQNEEQTLVVKEEHVKVYICEFLLTISLFILKEK